MVDALEQDQKDERLLYNDFLGWWKDEGERGPHSHDVAWDAYQAGALRIAHELRRVGGPNEFTPVGLAQQRMSELDRVVDELMSLKE